MNKWIAFLLSLGFLQTLPLQAEEVAPPKKIVTIEGITEYHLDNGLRILLYPDKSTSRVTVNMTVLVGSRHEGYGETGMAHLLEHMVFKGTPKHPNVPKTLRDLGASFNGTTWVDRTNYFESMNANPKNLEMAIRLEADRLVNSFIRREDLASEMTVVRNEFERGENSPTNILGQRMMATAFEWHNYGKSTIGNRSDIERVPVDRLRAFYRKYYRPDNVMLIIAGNFDVANALKFTVKYFGPLKNPKTPLENTYTQEPPQDGERTVVLRRVGKTGAVGALYHIPAAGHPDSAPLEVLGEVLDTEPNGRLYKELVKSGKASGVSSYAMAFHDPGVFRVMATVENAEKVQEAKDIMIDVLEKLDNQPLTEEEVQRAVRKLLKQREMQMNDVNRIGIGLSEWAARGDWRLFFLHRDRLEKVKLEDVQQVAVKYLKQSNRTVGMYFPTEKRARTDIPETPDLAKLLNDYKGRKAIAAGEEFNPTPENIEKRVKRSKLPSGIKVALLPKKTRGEAVVFRLTLRFGNEESLQKLVTAAEFLGPMMRRGAIGLSRQDLEDDLDKLKANLSISSDVGSLSCTVRCKRENLEAVLKLLEQLLRAPSFPVKEFEILKRQQIDGLEQSSTEPIALAQRKLVRTIRPHDKSDVRYQPTIQEEIARVNSLNRDALVDLYKRQLNGQHGELSVVGDFDADAVTKQVADILANWKSDTKFKRIDREANLSVKGQNFVINTPDKANAIYIAGHTLPIKDSAKEYPALQVANYLFGGAPLASRLSNRVRGKEGLSYTVASMTNADALNRYGLFMMYAISNPQNSEKVKKSIAEELEKIRKEGITKEELEQGKSAFLKQLKVRRGTDSVLASQLADGLENDRTFEYQAALEKAVANLTVEEVNAAIRKHLDPKRLVIVRAGDFKKK